MQKRLITLFSFLWIAANAFILSEAAAQERPMKIVFFNDFAPFSYIQNEKVTGILFDVLTEVLEKRMNVKIVFEAGPWARMQELVKTGHADAFCTNPTDARREYTVVSKVATIRPLYKIFTHNANENLKTLKAVKNLEDLQKQALAGKFTIGTYIGDGWVKDNLGNKGVKIDYAPSLEGTIKKVAFLRIDALVNLSIVQNFSMKLLLEKLTKENPNQAKEIQNIIELDNVIDVGRFHLCIGKTSAYQKLLEEFEKVMEQVNKEGFVDQVVSRAIETGNQCVR